MANSIPALAESGAGRAQPRLGLGRLATPTELRAWDIDVRPDGQGLPVGQGSVAEGEAIYEEKCAACHGDFGEGVGRWPPLAGGQGTLKSQRPVKTIGSYWPYLSTAYDYIYRTMPFGDAQSLTHDEVYALVAYIIYLNDLVDDEDFILSNKNFTSIQLPNETNFVPDPGPDTATLEDGEPCMKNCKSPARITMTARDLDVTPASEQKANKTEGSDQ